MNAHPDGRRQLRYVARSGLLPELSRQTYGSFSKALREAILNSMDASATRVVLDFSGIENRGEFIVSDDGSGMTTANFCDEFMSLGGSAKFGDSLRFGRIGIGSLALLQYGQSATVETKVAGAAVMTRAHIEHPWAQDRTERRQRLGEVDAGFVEEIPYAGPAGDHFTRVIVRSVNPRAAAVAADPSALYSLLEELRRLLPLSWSDGRLSDALKSLHPDLVETLREHMSEWCANVVVHSPWERNIELRRRMFGDDQASVEDWSGPPKPIHKTVRVLEPDGRSRRVTIVGYLLNQRRAIASWSGLTARVQNVAVEERTFFDVTADPGFRKYITGEIWLLGDLDRARLINIDRSSFNRECADYQAVQRYLSRAIIEFKSESVQRSQRAKVDARRRLEFRAKVIRATQRLVAGAWESEVVTGRALPSSEQGRGLSGHREDLATELESAGIDVVAKPTNDSNDLSYELNVTEDGKRVRALVGGGLMAPSVNVGGSTYAIRFTKASDADVPVAIRNRPREIVFNLEHVAHRAASPDKLALSLALEIAFLSSDPSDAAALYDRILQLSQAL